MKPLPPRQAFKFFPQTRDANLALYDALIKRLKEFSTNLETMIGSLFHTSSQLPVKRQKKGLSLSKAKSMGPTDFQTIEPDFTGLWTKITQTYINQNKGLSELNEAIRTDLLKKFASIREQYKQDFDEFEAKYTQISNDQQTALAKCKQAQQNYNNLCKQIEDLTARLASEQAAGKPTEIVSKTRMQLTDAKNSYQNVLESMLSEITKFNEIAAAYAIQCEKLLSKFEELDKSRAQNLDNLMDGFYDTPKVLADSKSVVSNEFYNDIQPLMTNDEVMKPNPEVDNQEPLTVTFQPRLLSFSLDTYLEPKKIFKDDIKQNRAMLKSDFSYTKEGTTNSFPKGTIVTILESKLTKYKVLNEETGLCATIPGSVLQKDSKYDCVLGKLSEDIVGENPSQITAQSGDFVVVKSVNNGIASCIDMYNRKAEIPVSSLKM